MPQFTFGELQSTDTYKNASEPQRRIIAGRYVDKADAFSRFKDKAAASELRQQAMTLYDAGDIAGFDALVAPPKTETGVVPQIKGSAKRAVGNLANMAGGAAAWADFDRTAGELRAIGESARAEGAIPDEVARSLGEFDLGDLAPGSGWWTTTAAEQLMTNLPLMAAAVGGAYAGSAAAVAAGATQGGALAAIGGGLGGTITGTPIEALMEASGAYNEVIDSGGDATEAGKAAQNVFWNNAKLLSGSNALTFGVAFKGVPNGLKRNIAPYLAKLALGATTEGTQEVVQSYYTEQGVSWALGDREDRPGWIPPAATLNPARIINDPHDLEAFVTGALMSLGMSGVPTIQEAAKAISTDINDGKISIEEALPGIQKLKDTYAEYSDEQLQQEGEKRDLHLTGETRKGKIDQIAQHHALVDIQREGVHGIADHVEKLSPKIQAHLDEGKARVSEERGEAAEITAVEPETVSLRNYIQNVKDILGADLVFVKGLISEGKKGGKKKFGANGWISADGKTIFVDINSANPYSQVIGHEITHELKKKDKAAYDRLVKMIQKDTAFNSEHDRLNKIREKNGYDTLGKDELEEEQYADFISSYAVDPRFLRRIAMRDPKTAKRAGGIIVNTLRRFTKRLPTNSEAYKAYDKQQAAVEKIFRIAAEEQETRDAQEKADQQEKDDAAEKTTAETDATEKTEVLDKSPAPKQTTKPEQAPAEGTETQESDGASAAGITAAESERKRQALIAKREEELAARPTTYVEPSGIRPFREVLLEGQRLRHKQGLVDKETGELTDAAVERFLVGMKRREFTEKQMDRVNKENSLDLILMRNAVREGKHGLVDKIGKRILRKVYKQQKRIKSNFSRTANTADEIRAIEAETKAKQDAVEGDIKFSRAREDRTMSSIFSGGGTLEAAMPEHRGQYAAEYDQSRAEAFKEAHGYMPDMRDILTMPINDIIEKVKGSRLFCASPVCKRFSSMRSVHGKAPTELDWKSAQVVAAVIEGAQPPAVSIENAPGYLTSPEFALIKKTLDENGYTYGEENVFEASEYGASTRRKRMVFRATKELFLPALSEKTGSTDWFAKIEDLLPTATVLKGATPNETRLIQDAINRGRFTGDKPIFSSGIGSGGLAESGGPTTALLAGNAKPKIIMPDGTTYAATPRMLARIQGLPDTYKLPDNERLARSIIGNGVNGEITRKIIAPLLETNDASRFSRAPQTDTPAFKAWFKGQQGR